MGLKKPKAILFDWDNTLVNTWPVIHEALHNTFTQMGQEPWTLDMVKKRVSRSMRDSFPQVFGEQWERAGDIYQKQYRAIHLQKLKALADAERTLVKLSKLPVYVAVVSNKKGPNLREEAKHFGWDKYFKKLVGANDTARDKPFPEPVYAALEGSGIKAGPDVWFVGDSVVDMEVAHVTGCIPVWYGDMPDEELSHEYSHRFGDHLEFHAALDEVFGV